jgi:transcriptional regulator with XRE-family HTH domain
MGTDKLQILRKNLRYLRKKHGYSQDFIAQICGKKSYTTIQKWETSGAEPNIATLMLLCDLYGVTINDIIYTDLSK